MIPSLRGVEASMKSQLTGPARNVGASAGGEAGAGFSSRFVSSIGSIASSVGRTFTNIAGLGAAAAAGFAATSIFKGWDRLTTIQDSTASLTVQLGSAGAAATLLSQVLDIVKGTPFSLDTFENAAAQLVAMGISAQKVPGYLTAIGEASATHGKQADDFASRLAVQFGQISAQGRIMGQDILQLSQTGVNALAILANHFGVSTSEMQTMISEGAVPAGEALDALSDGIINGSTGIAGATVAFGGTMQKLGQQLSGAFANFRTGMARFGASLLAPFSPALTKAFGTTTSLIDALGVRVGALAQRFVDSPGFQKFLDWLQTVPAKIGPLLDKLTNLGPLIAGIGTALGTLGAKQVPVLGQLVSGLNPFVAGIAALVLASPELRRALGDAFEAIKPSLAQVAAALGPALVDIAKAFADLLVAVVPLIPPLAKLVTLLVEKIGVPIIEGLSKAFEGLATALREHRPLLIGLAAAITTLAVPAIYLYTAGMISAAAATIAATWPIIAAAIVVGALVTAAIYLWTHWDQIWNWVKDHPAYAIILGILGTIVTGGFLPIILGLVWLAKNWSDIWGTIQSVVSTVWGVIVGIFGSVIAFFASVPGSILGALGNLGGLLVQAGRDVIGGLWNGIQSIWGFVSGFFSGLAGNITGAIGDAGSLLFDIGAKILHGLINGAKSVLGDVKDFFGGIADDLTSWKGPPEKDARLLIPAGQLIMDSFIAGAKSRMSDVESFFRGVAPILGVSVAGPEALVPRNQAPGISPLVQEATAPHASASHRGGLFAGANVTIGDQSVIPDLDYWARTRATAV